MVIGENKPDIQLLNKYVKPRAAYKWKDLGAQLMISMDRLTVIDQNYPRDAEACCTEMFTAWLRSDTKASWAKLVDALKAPDVGLHVLAEDIARQFGVGELRSIFTTI